MKAPAVTDDDVLHAFRVLYATELTELGRDPDPRDWLDDVMLVSLRRALEADRKRVAGAVQP